MKRKGVRKSNFPIAKLRENFWIILGALLLAGAASVLHAQNPTSTQQPPAAAQKKVPPDYSQEAFLAERFHTRVVFENDGTSRQETTVRLRVQSDAAVQQLGQLQFGYSSDVEKLQIDFVRVKKPNGGVIEAGASAVQDRNAPISRSAPMYTDLRMKHISVPALQAGDTLEYKFTKALVEPLAPGQFWFEYSFEHDSIVLDEELTILLPKGRDVKQRVRRAGPPATKEVTLEPGRTYVQLTWKNKVLERPSEEEEKKRKPSEDDQFPDLQISTFRSWAEVARWYASLEKERLAPTQEIRDKAAALTKDLKTPAEKAAALYDYVAKNFRYVSLSFGVGRIQPHAAGEVFANQYGDCKDKHTLLASLLGAVGLRSNAALIHSSRKLLEEFPSPSQFDHVVTVVEAGDARLWLDTTTEVAPFRMLPANLRGKKALVVRADGGAIEETPADPPFLSTQEVDVSGAINELGALEARVKYALRGDAELQLRLAFRRTARAEWKKLAGWIAASDGFGGEVTEVIASDPADTTQPFRFEFQVRQNGFFDWTNRRSSLSLPLPSVGLPAAGRDDEETQKKLELGSPVETHTRLSLTLPPGLSARAPVAVSVKRDYAEYTSSYSMDENQLTAERLLRFRLRELPAERRPDYQAFTRAVRNDEEQEFWVDNARPGAPTIPSDAKAEEIFATAQNAMQNGNYEVAANLFRRVTELEPKHKSAWNELGRASLALRRFDDAVTAFRKQLEVNPFDPSANNLLGLAYWRQQKYADAEAAFRKQIELNPLDRIAHASFAHMLREQRRYADAAEEFEKAIRITPQDASLHTGHGQALLQLGKTEEAMAAFDKAVELSPLPPVWNNIAYELSLKKVHLDRAQQYAESAVAATAAPLRNISLDRVSMREMALVSSIAAYWDTLGWVNFQRGDLVKAEKLILASWQLAQHGEVGDHLGQIYEKLGRKEDAIALYAQALAAQRPVPESRERLNALVKDEKQRAALERKGRETVEAMLKVPLEFSLTLAAEADFLLVWNSSGGVEATKFLRGEEKLREAAGALQRAPIPFAFPDDAPLRLVRRGTVKCTAEGKCVLTLLLPEFVTSVN